MIISRKYLLFFIIFIFVINLFSEEYKIKDEDKKFLIIETEGHTSSVSKLIFTKDGSEIITASYDKTIRIWDTNSGKLKRTFRGYMSDGAQGMHYCMALSPDNKLVATGGWLQGNYDGDPLIGAIRIYDYNSGKIVKVLKGLTNVVHCLEFSQDGKFLAASCGNGDIMIWDTKDYNKYFSGNIHSKSCYNLSFSPDSKNLVTVSADLSIKLFSIQRKKVISEVKNAHKDVIYRTLFSPNGKYIVTSSFDGEIKLWTKDLKFIKLVKRVTGSSSMEYHVAQMAFLNNETLICGGSYAELYNNFWYRPILKINILTGKEEKAYFHTNSVQSIAISNDGKLIASSGGNNSDFFIYDSNLLLKHSISGKGNAIFAVGFSYDGEKIFFGDYNYDYPYKGNNPISKSFSLVDKKVESYNKQEKYKNIKLTYNNITLSKSDYIYDNRVFVGNKTFTLPKINDSVTVFSFTDDGKYIIVGGHYGFYKIDSGTLEIKKEFIGHNASIWSIAISPDNKFLLSGSADQTMKIWDIESGSLLCSIFIGSDNEWIMWTESGYYNASVNGDKYIGYHINQGVDKEALFFGADRFYSQLYKPEVIDSIFIVKDETKALALLKSKDGSSTKEKYDNIKDIYPPVIEMKWPTETFLKVKEPKLNLEYSIKRKSQYPLESVTILLNGRVYITIDLSDKKDLDRIDLVTTIELKENNSLIAITAKDKYSVSNPLILSVELEILKKEEVYKPDLYVLAIGVSKYKNKEFNLNFADMDAMAIINIFSSQKGKLYNNVNYKLLINEEANRDNILSSLDWIYKSVTKKDVAIIFVAGHGVNDDLGTFYFLNHEADLDNLRRSAVKWSDFKDIVVNLPSKVLFFIDTCHSGNIMGSRRGLNDFTKAVKDIVNSGTGQVIMTATTGNSYSYEDESWGHGAFTLSIIDGIMKGYADYNRDNIITIKELDLYVTNNVNKITDGMQKPTTIIPESVPDFPVSIK